MRYSRRAWALIGAGAAAGLVSISGCSGSPQHASADSAGGTSPGSSASTAAPGSVTGTPAGGAANGSGKATGSAPRTSAPAAAAPTSGRDAAPQSNQASVLSSLPGTPAASCAVVGSHTDVRSGGIAAGNFQVARAKYLAVLHTAEVPEVFLYVIPQDVTDVHGVTISIDPTGPGVTRSVTSTSIEHADRWTYVSVNLPVRAPGSYRLTMVAGANRGCFDVSFGR